MTQDWLGQVRESLRSGNAAAALAACQARLSDDPQDADAWFLAGVAYGETAELAAAAQAMAKALRLRPDAEPSRRLTYAGLLLDLGQAKDAEAQARAALLQSPDTAPGLNVLGLALRAQGLRAEALEAFGKAHKADPSHRFAAANLADALQTAGRHDEAILLLERASSLDPRDARAAWRLARAYGHQVRLEDEIDAYLRAIAADDRDADLWCDLGNALANSGRQAQAASAYRESVRRNPALHQAASNLLIQMHYDPSIGADAIHAAHVEWARRYAAGIQPAAYPQRPRASRPRLGFLSPRLHEGPTATFLLPLVEHLDRRRFEVHLFDLGGVHDAVSEHLARSADRWHEVRQDSDDALAERIRREGIDILVDLAGHNPGGRPLALARKPAPVIVTWLDYFDTTGLAAVDYLIGDSVSTPKGCRQRFTERVLRLDPCRFCYSPPPYAPAVSDVPRKRKGAITFGSFNRLSKLTPAVVEVWAQALGQVPASHLLLKNRSLADSRTRDRIAAMFCSAGIEADRLELRGDSAHAQMLAEYGDVDIALDPFPFNGGLTTCEALWMGVPVLALRGDSMISRQSASLLSAGGLSDWIADDERDLVRRAAAFAGNPDTLAALRGTMRDRLSGSALMDAAGFARRFSAVLEEITA